MQGSAGAEELFLKAERSEEQGKLNEAFKYLVAAAELGDATSQLNLANFYSDGKGVSKNFAEAAKWYKRAYRNGSRSAALNLALDLKRLGHRRSALAWLNKAVQLNDGDACVALAKMYQSRARKIMLLNKAVSLSRDDITEDARAEARMLLEKLSTRS